MLAQSWADDESFVFLPSRTGVPLDKLKAALRNVPEQWRLNHFALLTSGTSGDPRLVFGMRERAEALTSVIHAVQDSEPVREAVVALPLSYSYAFVNQWLWARTHDRSLVLTRGFSYLAEFVETLSASRDAMLCLVGSQASILLEHTNSHRFEGIIRLHFAGGKFPQEKLPELREVFPNARIFNNYGCVEAMPRLTIRRAEDSDDPAVIGRPIPGVELSASAQSEIVFRSRYSSVGHLDLATGTPLPSGPWLSTGDLGSPCEDGQWRLEGRSGEVFKRYGEKVSVSRVRSDVSRIWSGQVEGYREKDARGEEGFVLVLCPTPDQTAVDGVLRLMRSSYVRAQWPLRIESVDVMPQLPNGKTDPRGLASAPGRKTHWRQPVAAPR